MFTCLARQPIKTRWLAGIDTRHLNGKGTLSAQDDSKLAVTVWFHAFEDVKVRRVNSKIQSQWL
jgi:hypothetical protein